MVIKNKEQLKTNVYNKLTEENIKTYFANSAPTSAHKLIGVNACMIRVYGMEHNIGVLESKMSRVLRSCGNNNYVFISDQMNFLLYFIRT